MGHLNYDVINKEIYKKMPNSDDFYKEIKKDIITEYYKPPNVEYSIVIYKLKNPQVKQKVYKIGDYTYNVKFIL